jgi:hypothetical protein
MEVMMRTNLKVALASIGIAALLAFPAAAGAAGYYGQQDYYGPQRHYARHHGYGYYEHSPYSYRRGGALESPNRHRGDCNRRTFPQCSGGN